MAGDGACARPSAGSPVPVFAPGCRLHLISEDEALLIGPGRHVALRGRPHALVAPLIDGRTPNEEIVAELAQQLPAAVVRLALMRLADRGLVVYRPPGSVPEPRPPA